LIQHLKHPALSGGCRKEAVVLGEAEVHLGPESRLAQSPAVVHTTSSVVADDYAFEYLFCRILVVHVANCEIIIY
jgi:hypothetical protein